MTQIFFSTKTDSEDSALWDISEPIFELICPIKVQCAFLAASKSK